MESVQPVLIVAGVLAGILLLCVAVAAVVLLARIVRGLVDLRERMDDLKLRLGVLDPGDTRVNPLAQIYHSQTKMSPSPHAPDETLPGNG